MNTTAQESKQQNLTALISRIEQTHHVFTRESIARIESLLAASGQADSNNIQRCFDELKADLLPHLLKEERVLFPYIVALESRPEQAPDSCFGSIANPIRMMGAEHQAVKNLLLRLRELTADYRVSPQADAAASALYAALAALDRDLVEHIRVENDELFPQALTLEKNSAG